MNHDHDFKQIPRCSLAKCECGKVVYRDNETIPRKVMVESESSEKPVFDAKDLCDQ